MTKLKTKSVSKRYISAVGAGLADLHEFVQATHLVNKASCWTLAEVVPGKSYKIIQRQSSGVRVSQDSVAVELNAVFERGFRL